MQCLGQENSRYDPPVPTRWSALPTVTLLAFALAACGGSDGDSPATTATTARAELPALASAPLGAGEVLFTGEASPASHGPFTLKGSYEVRFEQFAPEDPKLDFTGQTPFTARLRRPGSRDTGDRLFGAARASGRRTIGGHGRYVLDVTFGDFPYAVRFTPEP